MFAVSSKTPFPHSISSLDNALMHALEVWPEGKRRLHWCGGAMTQPSSPRSSDAKADNDSLRRKLRDSLTSALEMVVSKQLVKSVLGKTVEVEVAEVIQSRCNTDCDGTVHRSTEDSAPVKLFDGEVRRVDHPFGSNKYVCTHADGGFDAMVGDTQERLFMLTTAERSSRCDYHSEVDKATADVVAEAKGGIQLMEQARKVAWSVELNLFSLNGGVNKKYKEKARSLLFNLKDKSNPELRARVFKGEINPESLVSMSAAELASKELCQWRNAKAEEFASMVVLTEADMDPRRIVKKTHKGEFHVVVDDIGVSAGAKTKAVRSAFPTHVRGGKGGGAVFGRISKGDRFKEFLNISSVEDCEADPQPLSEIYVSHETVENETLDMEEPADDLVDDLPPMSSQDEGIEWHRASEIKEPCHTIGSVRDGEMKAVLKLHSESIGDETWTDVFPSLSVCGPLKLGKSASTSLSDPLSGSGVWFSKSSEAHSVSSVWEGSLQLSANRSVFIGGFYKRLEWLMYNASADLPQLVDNSRELVVEHFGYGLVYGSGVRLELKDWPQSVEVKGRVRLEVLDKFLRDLQLSRSRTMTVLSLCPSDGQGDAKRMGAYLKEIADHYRMGDRAGFAEPKPGFELYLLAPGSACLDLLVEEQKSINVALKTEDEVLIGVVVWRKALSQGLSSNRVPKQSCNVRKVASSNLLCGSTTSGNAQPLHRKETTSSRGSFSTSLNNVSGDPPMHSTQSLGGSSGARDPQPVRDYDHKSPAPIGLHPPSLIGPLNRVLEDARCTLTGSCLLPQCLSGREDLPGFICQTKPPVAQATPAVLKVQTKQRVDSQGSPSGAGGVPGALVHDRKREVSTTAPPGFLPKLPGQLPTRASQRIRTVFQQDDDDLPEFNFDAEEEAQRKPANHLTARKTVFVAGHACNGVPQPVTGLQRINYPTNRYQVHDDVCIYQPSSMDLQSLLNGPLSGHIFQQEESSASQSVSLFPSSENWNNGVFAREIAERVTQRNISRCTFLSNRIDHGNLSSVATEDLATCEKLRDNSHHSSGVFGYCTSMPSVFTSSGAAILSGVSRTAVVNGFLPRNCPSPVITQIGWPGPGLSPTLSSHSQHNSQQARFLNMVIQHEQKEMKTSVFSSAEGMPLPHQEVRQHEWQAIGANDPSELSPSNSKQVYSRYKRKMEPTERTFTKVRASEFTGKDTRLSRGRSRPRQFCWEPSLDSTTERGPKRWGRRSACPAKGTSLVSDDQGGPVMY